MGHNRRVLDQRPYRRVPGRGPGRQPAVELQPSRVSNGRERRRRAVLVGRPKPAARYRARPRALAGFVEHIARVQSIKCSPRGDRGGSRRAIERQCPPRYLSENGPCCGRVGACPRLRAAPGDRDQSHAHLGGRRADVRVRDADLLSPAGRVLLDPHPNNRRGGWKRGQRQLVDHLTARLCSRSRIEIASIEAAVARCRRSGLTSRRSRARVAHRHSKISCKTIAFVGGTRGEDDVCSSGVFPGRRSPTDDYRRSLGDQDCPAIRESERRGTTPRRQPGRRPVR